MLRTCRGLLNHIGNIIKRKPEMGLESLAQLTRMTEGYYLNDNGFYDNGDWYEVRPRKESLGIVCKR